MKQIKILDCTLRDGGFLNDWNFGHQTINNIFNQLVNANIDIIEIGFIDEKKAFDSDRTINPNTKSFDKILNTQTKNNTQIVAMVRYGHCSIENIAEKEDSIIDGIRIIFKKEDKEAAIKFSKQIKEKGYQVFINPVSISSYTNGEILELINLINDLEPTTMSIVDTCGLLHKKELFEYFKLLDNSLKKEIAIGYHSHNNFQLAYSNSIELLELETERNIIIDSSLYGMGKSAGNCNTELIAMYLNEHFDKNYDLLEILNAIKNEILQYSQNQNWGYQLSFFLSALNSCHSTYAKYLENKKNLSIKDIDVILQKIDSNKKFTFDENYIEDLYKNYTNHCNCIIVK